MKKIIICMFYIIISVDHLSAQIRKGQWLAGGNISFAAQGTSNSSIDQFTSFAFLPQAGYFFINNLAVGLQLDFRANNQKIFKANTEYTISPFVRYYFLPAIQKINVFAEASYGLGSSNNGYGSTSSHNQFTFDAGPAVFLSPTTALDSFYPIRLMEGKIIQAGLQVWDLVLDSRSTWGNNY